VPERVRQRPSPDQWSETELLTLAEAAALFWPTGPLTVTTLRTATRDGELGVARIAGKLFTSKSAIQRMSVCVPRPQVAPPPRASGGSPPVGEDDLLARIQARRLRAKS
jgi:hypothetical protein